MTEINGSPSFDPVPQLERTFKVEGGDDGPANFQAKALANRTVYLWERLQAQIQTLNDLGVTLANQGQSLDNFAATLATVVSDLTNVGNEVIEVAALATTAQALANSGLEGLEDKVDKVVGKALSTEDFTTAEKDKLAGLESSHFKGLFPSLASLQAAVISPVAGDYADVDSGEGNDVTRYLWDVSDSDWTPQLGESAILTAAQVKSLYEANPNTNVFTDEEKDKLLGLETSHYKGLYTSLLELQGTVLFPVAGDYADVDFGEGNDVIRYLWDTNDSIWVEQLGQSAQLNAQQVKTLYESNPDTNAFTDAEKTKLGVLEYSHYKGLYTSVVALQLAVTSPVAGDYADIDLGVDSEVVRYIWDNSDLVWTSQLGESSILTAVQVKTLYEANPDTNAFTDAERDKLGNLTQGMLSPMTAQGDLIIGGVGGVPQRLPIGQPGQLAVVNQAGNGIEYKSEVPFPPVIVDDRQEITLSLLNLKSWLSCTSATPVNVYVPAQTSVAWPANAEIHIEQADAGSVTIMAATGAVTVHRLNLLTATIAGQYGVVSLKRKAENVWVMFGALGMA